MLHQDGARRRQAADVHGVQFVLGLSEPQQQRVQRLVELLQKKKSTEVRGQTLLVSELLSFKCWSQITVVSLM